MKPTLPTGKIILFAGLGLVGMFMVGFGALQLILPMLTTPVVNTPVIPTSGVTLTLPTMTETTRPIDTPSIPTDTPQPSVTVTLTPTAWEACPNTFLSKLRVGMKAKLNAEPPVPNRVREQANTTSKILGLIQPGETVEIVDGPGCANNWVWWKIKKSDGLIGWTAEGDGKDYWLLPIIP